MVPLPSSPNAPGVNAIDIAPKGVAIAALSAGLENGSITYEDLLKRARNPELVQLQKAKAASEIQDLQSLPIRRQQEMDAATQAAKMNELKIQEAQYLSSDEQRQRARRLSEAETRAKELEVENLKDPTGLERRKLQNAAKAEAVKQYIERNGVIPPLDPVTGEYDLTPPSTTVPDLTPVLGPDGKEVAGFGKDRKGQLHTIPRSAAPTEAQANAQTFAGRMAFQRPILEGYETGTNKEKYDPTAKAQMPEVRGGNPLATPLRVITSPDHNTYADAKRNWIAAVLRKESGASISASEEANANAQYFPQPTDTPAQVLSKQKLRKEVEEQMTAIGSVPGVQGLSGKTPTPSAAPAGAAPAGATAPVKPGTKENPVSIDSEAARVALPEGVYYSYGGGLYQKKAETPPPAAVVAPPAPKPLSSAPIVPAQKPLNWLERVPAFGAIAGAFY